jgi:hypothetical protein
MRVTAAGEATAVAAEPRRCSVRCKVQQGAGAWSRQAGQHTHTQIRTHSPTHARAHTITNTNTHTHTHIHTHIHTYASTHTHTHPVGWTPARKAMRQGHIHTHTPDTPDTPDTQTHTQTHTHTVTHTNTLVSAPGEKSYEALSDRQIDFMNAEG